LWVFSCRYGGFFLFSSGFVPVFPAGLAGLAHFTVQKRRLAYGEVTVNVRLGDGLTRMVRILGLGWGECWGFLHLRGEMRASGDRMMSMVRTRQGQSRFVMIGVVVAVALLAWLVEVWLGSQGVDIHWTR
jgi:hypothetical protein